MNITSLTISQTKKIATEADENLEIYLEAKSRPFLAAQ